MTVSWAPTPYFLFYGLSALLGRVMPVVTAAKLLLCVAGGLIALGASDLADACGRSPRLGAAAPLAMFGIGMGYGFASFVFATPLLFFCLAAAERLLHEEDPRARTRRVLSLGALLCLAYLGHALIFLTASLLIGLRTAVEVLRRARAGLRAAAAPLVRIAAAAAISAVVAAPSALAHVRAPWKEAGTGEGSGATQLASFSPLSEHLARLNGDLLHRGSDAQVLVMRAAAALFIACLLLSLFRPERGPRRPPPGFGLELYASALVLLFLFGPMSLEWPSSAWLTYPRFGVIAGAAVFLLPRGRLAGPLGWIAVASCLALVGWNAELNARGIRHFSSLASRYDPVRAAVPPKTRVLALSVVGEGDLTNAHQSLKSLYFYHLVDGASYTAFLFDNAALPVRQKPDVRPRAPFWRTPHLFDPATEGRDFDYLVLRGSGLVERTRAAGHHELAREIDGWFVFRTLAPTPRPMPE